MSALCGGADLSAVVGDRSCGRGCHSRPGHGRKLPPPQSGDKSPQSKACGAEFQTLFHPVPALRRLSDRRILGSMSTVTIALPDPLDAALRKRMAAIGVVSTEEYLLELIASDCAASELEQTLEHRFNGPFEPLEADWKERVRHAAARLG